MTIPTLALTFNGLSAEEAASLLAFVPTASLTIGVMTPAQTAQVLGLFNGFLAAPETVAPGAGGVVIGGDPGGVSAGAEDVTIDPSTSRRDVRWQRAGERLMAAGPFTVYSNAALEISQAGINLASDTIVMVLLTSAYTPAPDTDTHWSDVSADEVATGAGYTAGGQALTETDTLAGHLTTFTFAGVTWTAFSGTFRYVALVRRAGASLTSTDKLIAFADFSPGGGSLSGTGSDFTISPSASGAFTFGSGATGILLATRTATNWGTTTAPAGATYQTTHWFKEGAVPAGSIAVIRSGATTVPTQQADNQVYWPDKSLRGAVFNWAHPNAINAGASDSITFATITGAWNQTSVSPASAITTAHDYQMRVVIAGATYYFRINNEIATATRLVQTRSGPACSAYKVWGDLRSNTGPADPIQGQLWATAHFSIYADGTFRVLIEAHCNKLVASASIAITSYGLYDGSTPLITQPTSFTFFTQNKIACLDADARDYYSGADHSQVIWKFPAPVAADPTSTGLYDSLTTWFYQWTPAMIAAFPAPVNVAYAPNASANTLYAGAVDATGDSEWIGPMGRHQVTAMHTGRYDYHRGDRQYATGGWGAALYWCADPVTGLPPVFLPTTYAGLAPPTVSLGWNPGSGGSIAMTGGSNAIATGNSSHAPNWFWWQYLAGGEEWALENCFEQAVGVLGAGNPTTSNYGRNPTIAGKVHHGLVQQQGMARIIAWGWRNLSNSYWACPDAHPMKPYLNDLVQAQYDGYTDYIAALDPTMAALGIVYTADYTAGAPNAPTVATGEGNNLQSVWMHDYWTTTVTMDIRRGRITETHPVVSYHIKPFGYGRMTNGNFFELAGPYRISVRAGPNPAGNAPFAQQWSDVYGRDDYQNLIYPGVDSPPITSGLVDTTYTGPYVYPPLALAPNHNFTGHTYPGIALVAAHCGNLASLSGGQPNEIVAYLGPLIDGSSTATEAAWGAGPEWRIRPPS